MAQFHIEHGDLFEAPAQAIVNPVNCVGVMGAGLARAFAARYPEYARRYKALCEQKKLKPGRVDACWMEDDPGCPQDWILSFPTKKHWREKSRISYIESGLDAMATIIPGLQLQSVAFPAIGCGLGGLRWAQVQRLIEIKLGQAPAKILLYPPHSSPRAA